MGGQQSLATLEEDPQPVGEDPHRLEQVDVGAHLLGAACRRLGNLLVERDGAEEDGAGARGQGEEGAIARRQGGGELPEQGRVAVGAEDHAGRRDPVADEELALGMARARVGPSIPGVGQRRLVEVAHPVAVDLEHGGALLSALHQA